MPFWSADWGASGGAWWLFPLFCLIVMGVMALVCFRGFGRGVGCMGQRAEPGREDIAEFRRELQELKDAVRKLVRHPD